MSIDEFRIANAASILGIEPDELRKHLETAKASGQPVECHSGCTEYVCRAEDGTFVAIVAAAIEEKATIWSGPNTLAAIAVKALEPYMRHPKRESAQPYDFRAALQWLVSLKNQKDLYGKTEQYEREQPKAWEAAKKALATKRESSAAPSFDRRRLPRQMCAWPHNKGGTICVPEPEDRRKIPYSYTSRSEEQSK